MSVFAAGRLLYHWICSNKANVPADLQSAGIEYKDFQSETHTYKLYIGSKWIENPYILCCRIAYPTEH